MHVDPLEPVAPGPHFDEVTEIRMSPADVSAWTPTVTLHREVEPVPSALWTLWLATVAGLLGVVVMLTVALGLLWFG